MISLDEEATLLDALTVTGRVGIDVLGESVQGRPIRLVRIGAPQPPADNSRAMILHVGAQHGTEIAGREALLHWAQHLATVQAEDIRLNLPGGTGDTASTPDHNDLDITGDLDISAEITPNSWNTNAYVVSKYQLSGNQRSYALRIRGTRQIGLNWSTNGSSFNDAASTVAIPAGTTRLAIRVTLRVNDEGAHTVTFYTAPSIAGPWDEFGDPVTASGTTSIFSGTAPVAIGSRGDDTNHLPGAVHAVQIRDGIGESGTLATGPDFTEQTPGQPSVTDSTGKTWTLAGNAAIVDAGDPDTLDFLTAHGVLMVPTANPDGVEAATRTNAHAVDLNRDHIALGEPETRALATVMGRTRPAVIIDHHETTLGNNNGNQVTFGVTANPQADAGLVDQAEAILAAYAARADAESWDNGRWPAEGTSGEDRLRNTGGLRNAATVLIETTGLGSNAQPEQDRVDQHYAMCEETLTYAAANNVIAEADDAADRVTAAGAAGEPFNLGTTILDPAPLAYQLTGILPSFHLDVFNIHVDGGIAAMAQPAQPVIPYLLDAAAEQPIVHGIRIFTPGAPVVVTTVQDLAPLTTGSHRVVFEARVLTEFQTGADPHGIEIPILGGDVIYDATADMFASIELETAMSETDQRSLFPRRAGDLLAPYGNELFVRRGIDTGDRILWSPLGYFRINAAEQTGGAGDPIRISGQDRMAQIVDARRINPHQYRAGTTIGTFVWFLARAAYADVVIAFDDDSDQATLGRSIIVEESRHGALLDTADALGKIVYFDGHGILRIEDAPDPDDIATEIRSGHDGVLVKASRRVTRERMRNAIVATGEAATGLPVRGVAFDVGATSPTRWGSRFGKVRGEFSSPLLQTNAMAQKAAVSILRRQIGMPYSVDFGAIPNPALRPRQMIRITQRDGNREKHLIDTLTMPLTHHAPMTGTTKEQTHVAIGGLPGGFEDL